MLEIDRSQYNQKPRELISSKGFSVDYEPIVTDKELRDDIVSYLGEYRFELQKYDYELVFSQGKIRDPHRLESMSTKAQRSINEKKLSGESAHREKAELIGITFLEKQLEFAREGNSIVWASPPGPKEEGYGDYGFFFIGKIKRSNGLKKDLAMTAIRVEYPQIPEYSKAFRNLTGASLELKSADDFLKLPLVVEESLSPSFIDKVLSDYIKRGDPREKEKFQMALRKLEPWINQFISHVRWGTPEEKKKAFHALENYALQVKKELQHEITAPSEQKSFAEFVNMWGFEPPKVKGSCPIKSGNVMTGGYSFLNKIVNQEWFMCPKCSYKADGPVGNKCPGCGLTKEAYAQETGIACD